MNFVACLFCPLAGLKEPIREVVGSTKRGEETENGERLEKPHLYEDAEWGTFVQT